MRASPRLTAGSYSFSRYHLIFLASVALLLGTASCGNTGTVLPVPTAHTQEVLAAASCIGPRCVSPAEALELLGYLPIEPTALPSRFALYERYVESLEWTEGRDSISDAPMANLVLEYRYQGSPHIPALTVIETRNPAGPLTIVLAEESCGEILDTPEGRVLYGIGAGEVFVDDNERDYHVCPTGGPPARDAHAAYLAKNDIFIEIKGFPEARLTRDDMLNLARSLLRQMR